MSFNNIKSVTLHLSSRKVGTHQFRATFQQWHQSLRISAGSRCASTSSSSRSRRYNNDKLIQTKVSKIRQGCTRAGLAPMTKVHNTFNEHCNRTWGTAISAKEEIVIY